LAAPRYQLCQRLAFGIGERAWVRQQGHDLGLERVGFGEPPGSTGEVPDLPWINDGDRKMGASQSRSHCAREPPVASSAIRGGARMSSSPRFVADKAFDQNSLRAQLNERGATTVIPCTTAHHTSLIIPMYKWRHLIENCFQRLKEFRRVATRYAKPTQASRLQSTSPQLFRHSMNVYRP
jgi:transposase